MGFFKNRNKNKTNKPAGKQVKFDGKMPQIIEVSKMSRDRKNGLEAQLKLLQSDIEKTSVALNEQIITICAEHDIDFNTKNIKWDPTGSALVITDRPAEPAPGEQAQEEAPIISPENNPENGKEDQGAVSSEQEGNHQDQSGDPEAKV
jgi:hypothetical protein